MIPPFDSATGNLPPGVHEAAWQDLVARYGWTPRRLALMAGLKAALDALRAAGCRRAYIDGSFATAKEEPADFDCCWEAGGVDLDRLDPVLLDFSRRRATQKAKYGGELFLAHPPADPLGTRFVDFFQRDKETGETKRIIPLTWRACRDCQ